MKLRSLLVVCKKSMDSDRKIMFDLKVQRPSILIGLIIITMTFSCTSGRYSIKCLDPGVSLELAEMRARQLSEIRYELEFNIPPRKEEAILGKLRLNFQLHRTSAPLILDFKVPDNHLTSVSVRGKEVPYLFVNEHIILESNLFQRGDNELEIEFLAGNLSMNRQEDFLYTLFVPDRARTAFPCFDQPDLKARFGLKLELPRDWLASTNSRLINQSFSANRKTLRYDFSDLIPTYLFAFAAGSFESKTDTLDGREMTMLYRESDGEKVQRNSDQIFEIHGNSLKWLESYTGIPYPFQKFDFVLIPTFQYGGMEHVGNIFYREESLMLDENPTINQQLRRATLVAHETAHMWFGDLVTMKWFNDVWMKEVFANFMAAKIINPQFPEIDHELRFLAAHHASAYAEDRSMGTHPIQQALDNLENAGSLYGNIIYQKAPIVMLQLEHLTGDSIFRSGLQKYLNEFSFGNATWDDLIGILDAGSEKDLKAWSKAWVKEAGMPEISVYWEQTGNEIQLELNQLNTTPEGSVWPQTTTLYLVGDSEQIIPSIDIEKEKNSFTIQTPFPEVKAILPNAAPYSYGYFRLPEKDLQYFLQHIEGIQNPLYRGAIRISIYESLVRDEDGVIEPFLPYLLNGLKMEMEPLNRQILLSQLETMVWRFMTPDERRAKIESIENEIWELLVNSEDKSTQKIFLEAYSNLACSEEGILNLRGIYDESIIIPGLSISESEKNNLALELALRLPDDAFYILDVEIARTENPDRRKRIEYLKKSFSPDQQERDAFFNSLKDPANREVEPWVLTALTYLHHPLRSGASIKYIKPSLEMLEEIQKTGDIFFPRRWATATLSGYQTQEVVDIVNGYLAEHPELPAHLKRKVLMSADMLFRAAEVLQKQDVDISGS